MSLVVTLLKDGNDVFGGRCKVQHANIALDNSYPTGGYLLPASKFFGPKAVLWNLIIGDFGIAAGGAYRYFYDYVNFKLMVFQSSGDAPAGTIVSTFTGSALAGHSHTVPVTAGTAGDAVTNNAGVLESTGGQDLTTSSDTAGTPAGTIVSTFTGDAGTASGFSEVPNATNLATITALRVTAFGR